MTVTDSQAKQDALVKEFRRARPDDFNDIGEMYIVYLSPICSQTLLHFAAKFWAGWNDNKNEGKFSNYYTGKVLTKEDGFWPWYPGEPNGGTLENCAVVWANRDAWNDFMCFEKALSFCNIQPRPRLVMRGNYKNTQVYFNIPIVMLVVYQAYQVK